MNMTGAFITVHSDAGTDFAASASDVKICG